MKSSTKDQVEGRLLEAKGKFKEKVGRATANPRLNAEGQDDKVVGVAQKKVGQIKSILGK